MEPKNENLSSQAKLWSFIYGFAESLLLKCAVELDIANIIHSHGAPMTLSELSLRLPNQPVSKNALYRIMRYLVHMKLFTQSSIESEPAYALAPPAKFLVKGWDKCMVGTILATADEDFMAPWHYLKDGLSGRSDKTVFEKALGVDIWGYLAAHPEKSKMFNEAMANDTRVIMSVLLRECTSSFEGVATLVDVGGGTGTAVRYIVEAFPGIKCTVYDLPQVIAEAPRTSGIDFVEGDMFNYIPNADAILMKWILHDWGDKECVQILKRCKEAVPREGGKVIIIDIVLDTESQHPYTERRLTMDLNMMLAEGKERTEVEWKKLITHDAGYKGYKITHISALQSVIEAYPY